MSLEGASDQATILTPDTPEELRASLTEALRKDYPETYLNYAKNSIRTIFELF